MAEIDIVQNMISQLGQSQGERMPETLGTHFVDVDERTTEDLLRFAKKFAPFVNYYRYNTSAPAGNWTKFFSYDDDAAALGALRQNENADTPPHLALFLSFLELYRQPQAIINRFTGRHLDFYYHDVLRLRKKPAVPDKAHVLLELKKQSPPIVISSEDIFSAGKDNTKIELIYAPTRETIINAAKVDSLRSIFLETSGQMVKWAPIANSSDGVGGALPEEEPKWDGFGHAGLAPAEVGFAVASPVLRMKEGGRTITINLTLSNAAALGMKAPVPTDLFNAFITAEKNWASLDITSITLSSDSLELVMSVRSDEKAIVDYAPSIHGYYYTTEAPVLQLLLNPEQRNVGYDDFKGVTVEKIQVAVTVDNITTLNLENDAGALDAKKAFLPFGPEPAPGSLFSIDCDEALSKKLSKIDITINWKATPEHFSIYYHHYGVSVGNGSFLAGITFVDANGTVFSTSGATLFESEDARLAHTIPLTPGVVFQSSLPEKASNILALRTAGGGWAQRATKLTRMSPVFRPFLRAAPAARPGFIQFELQSDFLHATYRRKHVANVMTYSREGGTLLILNEPYTPAIQSISLRYEAHSDEVNVASTALKDFSNLDVEFFHVAFFGQMREHGFQRDQFAFLADKRVSLLPAYDNEGELLIGLSNLNPGDSVSVLFQVAEGSADPELTQEKIAWSVLCENYWKTLGPDGVVLDTTNQLLTSGIIKFVIPSEATTQNTILSADLIWLRGGVTNARAVCQLIAVAANVAEVQFQDQGNDPGHLASALEAGKITKLRNGLAAVKKVKQPYASFGGKPEESDNDFYRRVSERLRHKDRCIAPWDYERIVLEEFPRVHKVKCIPHAREGNWFAPGHILLVVIPDLTNKLKGIPRVGDDSYTIDPLEPKVDANTISRITDFVRARAGNQVQVKVKNPDYQKIQLDFKVKFRRGYEFNHYSEELKAKLIEFLSPWAFAADRDISFGGKIYKSVLLDLVEELAPVDYVTDFKMYSYIESSEEKATIDVNEARPKSPDAILVSEATHLVNEVPDT
jgi:hypothetical protein